MINYTPSQVDAFSRDHPPTVSMLSLYAMTAFFRQYQNTPISVTQLTQNCLALINAEARKMSRRALSSDFWNNAAASPVAHYFLEVANNTHPQLVALLGAGDTAIFVTDVSHQLRILTDSKTRHYERFTTCVEVVVGIVTFPIMLPFLLGAMGDEV